MKKSKEKKILKNSGITLIALVITVIVLLILAGVTVATLTGDNGLLTKANDAKITTTEAEGLEKIQLAVMASHDKDGIDTTSLAENLSKINNLTLNNQAITEDTEISLPILLKLNNVEYSISKKGKVEVSSSKMWIFNGEKNIIGNWLALPYRSSWAYRGGYKSQTYGFNLENKNLKITGSGEQAYGLVYLTDSIDLSLWNKIYINVTATDAIDAMVTFIKKDALQDNFTTVPSGMSVIRKSGLYSADISEINDECYVIIYAGVLTYFDFDELYLTRE